MVAHHPSADLTGSITNNTATEWGGGLLIAGSATISGTDIENNGADTGGGVYVEALGTVSFDNCDVLNNTASAIAPGIAEETANSVTLGAGNYQPVVKV